MKRVLFMLLCLGLLAAPATVEAQRQKKATKTKSLEGEKVRVVSEKMQGIEISETLSEDGTEIIKRPYRWYAGIGEADDKQMAIEMAQREAYATISRVLTNAVLDEAERGKVVNNGVVEAALKSHWEQVSSSVQSACEPFGDARIEYNPKTGMYNVTAKVGIRGDHFVKLIQNAGIVEPQGLNDEERKQFIEVNQQIIEAAKR